MTRLLVLSGLIGALVAGFAICMEQFGVWPDHFSPIFLFFALPVIGLAWGGFLWKHNKVKLTFQGH